MSDRQLKGIGVSPGIGVGAAIVVRWTMPEVPHRVVPRSQVEREGRRLRAAGEDCKSYSPAPRAKGRDRDRLDDGRMFRAQSRKVEHERVVFGAAGLRREEHLA